MEVCCTLGMLTERSGAAPGRRRAYRLQPQSGHLAGVLRRDHHHAALRRSPAHDCRGAQGRHHGLLRRNHRHGRIRRRPHRPAAPAGRGSIRIPKACPSTCWCASRERRSANAEPLDPLTLVRMIATARVLMPASHGAPKRRPPLADARSGRAVFPRRSELDLRGRQTAHHAQSRAR